MKSLHLPLFWHHVHHRCVVSTMLCCEALGVEPGHFLLVTADEQTAGRGQRGTVWESAAGENLTFSVAWRNVGVAARDQFLISEAVALSVAETVAELLKGTACTEAVSVKWPNDVYVGERKICGMLIEHSLSGPHIDATMAGIGLNVNQRHFCGDAPNPVSLCQLAGQTFSLTAVMERIVRHLHAGLAMLQEGRYDEMEERFAARLFRREGWHPYRDAEGEFTGRFAGIARNGMLTLEKSSGEHRTYAFKEVACIIPPMPQLG